MNGRGIDRCVLFLAGAGGVWLMSAQEAAAWRGGGFGAGLGSVRYAGWGGSWDDEPWNAGFDGGPSPAALTAGKQVATVSPAGGESAWHPYRIQNRIDTRAPSEPLNYGSVQYADVGNVPSIRQYTRVPGGVSTAGGSPYAGRILSAPPEGYTAMQWQGVTYYQSGYDFYRPYWYGGQASYWPVSAPLGWFSTVLPAGAVQQTIDNVTYYRAADTCCITATRDGRSGYQVVEPPDAMRGDPAGGPPDPRQLLQAMSDYLGGQARLTLTTDDTFEEITKSGAKVHVSTKQTACVERPDKAAITVIGDGCDRRILYDSKALTVVDRQSKMYATIPATGSLDSVLDTLAMTYAMTVPGDWLYPDLYQRMERRIQSGHYVGMQNVGGNLCHHLIFGLSGVDWQIWIQVGDPPVPRKMVVSYTTTPGRPRYVQEITGFNTGPIPASVFQVDLPPGAHKIDFLPAQDRGGSVR